MPALGRMKAIDYKWPEVLYHPRHKLCFYGHKYLKSRLVVAPPF